ncbi:RlpA-like double-psi beta-barrel-protein domain-containing protein-containing protein [Mrakia frigida]|uniref:RlpA-like double-psi beta-barrel domain-containing protein n=1 Tax=Mrakia frigida TaxID=29902 RepID=UPI003FCC07BC
MLAAIALVAALSPLALAAPVEVRQGSGSRFTYYDTSVGLGSCGVLHQNSEYTVALNSADMASYGSSYPSPACGKSIWVTYGGKTVSATIQDTCPSCGSGELDLSAGLFSALADHSLGVIYGSWGYNGESAPAETTPAPAYVAPTTTTPAWTPEPTTEAWVQPTTTEEAWVAPTTEAAYTPATTTASPAAATHTAVVETSSPAAAATSSWTAETWASIDAPTMCPNSTLVLFDDESVLFNGTYAPQLNGTNTLLANVSAMVINSLLPNATAYCFNSTFSLYNASTFNLTSPTSSNSSTLFSIFASVSRS